MTSNNNNKNSHLPNNDEVAWSFWLGLGFFIAVFSLILIGSWRLFDRMMANEAAPISVVQVSGEMPYTNQADIAQALTGANLGNFFQLDVNQIQSQVESLSWVKSASVRKQWPNQLSIYIVDHVPAAVWNQKALLSQDGLVFDADKARVQMDLPQFYGPQGAQSIALKNYRQFNQLLSVGDLSIAQIALSDRHAWQVTLSDGVVLNLGREKRIERMQRFIDVYPQILQHKNENQQVNYIDLRYDTGVSVGWKQAEDERV